MTLPIHMGCNAALGEGGLGYHLEFIRKCAQQSSQLSPHVYCVVGQQPGEQTQTFRSEPTWMFLYHYSPGRWMTAKKLRIQLEYFDRHVQNRLPKQKIIYHSFPGCAERSFKTVAQYGGINVLEAATTHVDNVFKSVSREHKEFKLGGNPFSEKWKTQVLREYELADYITVSSTLQRESFIQNGYPANKLLFAPLGIDTNKYSPLANQASMRPRDGKQVFRIIQVGQVSLLKGFQYVLQALEVLRDSQIELVLLGGVGWRGIRKIIQSYEKNGIKVINATGDPLPWLRSSHLCIHASVQDGFGLAPLEAMACGVPVILTNTTGVRDAVDDGLNGYIIERRNVESMVNRVKYLKEHDDVRIAMGKRARKSALRYDVKTASAEYSRALLPVWSSP